MEGTLQTTLRSADTKGRVTLLTADYPYIERTAEMTRHAYFDAIFESFARRTRLSAMTCVMDIGRDLAKLMEADFESVPGTEDYRVSFSLVRALRLPGIKIPSEELEELASLLDSLKPFFEAHAAQRPFVSVRNHRDRNKKTFGTFQCIFVLRTGATQFDGEATNAAMNRILASPVLSSWLHQRALDLNKLGPHSWSTFEADAIFEYEENPTSRHRYHSISAG